METRIITNKRANKRIKSLSGKLKCMRHEVQFYPVYIAMGFKNPILDEKTFRRNLNFVESHFRQ